MIKEIFGMKDLSRKVNYFVVLAEMISFHL